MLRKGQTEKEKEKRGKKRKTGEGVSREGHFSGTDKEEDLGVKLEGKERKFFELERENKRGMTAMDLSLSLSVYSFIPFSFIFSMTCLTIYFVL